MTSVQFSALVSMCRPQMDGQATKHQLHIEDLFLIYKDDDTHISGKNQSPKEIVF